MEKTAMELVNYVATGIDWKRFMVICVISITLVVLVTLISMTRDKIAELDLPEAIATFTLGIQLLVHIYDAFFVTHPEMPEMMITTLTLVPIAGLFYYIEIFVVDGLWDLLIKHLQEENQKDDEPMFEVLDLDSEPEFDRDFNAEAKDINSKVFEEIRSRNFIASCVSAKPGLYFVDTIGCLRKSFPGEKI